MTQIPKALPPCGHITVRLQASSNKKHHEAITALVFATGIAVGALLVTYGRSWFSGPATLLSGSEAPTHVVKSCDDVGRCVLKLETCPLDADGLFACSDARAEVYEPFMINDHRFFFVRQCELGENNVFDCPKGQIDIPTQWLENDGVCSKEPCPLDPFEDFPVLGQCLPDECSPTKKWFW